MRAAWIAGFLLLVLPAVASAAPVAADLVSDSPVDIFGRATQQAEGLRIFHQSTRDASLKGSVYNGTLIDQRTYRDCFQRVVEEGNIVRSVETGDLANIMSVELGRDSLVIFSPAVSRDFELADEPSTMASSPDSLPPLYLAPNPYAFVAPDDGTNDPSHYAYGEAFSRDPHLLAPTSRFDIKVAGTLVLEIGTLRVTQNGQTDQYSARVEQEQRTCSPNPLLPTPPNQYAVAHTYRLVIGTGVLNVEQASLGPFREFMDGERGPIPSDQPPLDDYAPPGHWPMNEGADLSRAYDEYGIPHTFLSASALQVTVDGALRFHSAFGTVRENQTITEVDGEELLLSGNLVAKPTGADDGGARTQTNVGGDLFVLDVARGPTSKDWTPFVAGAMGGAIALGLVAFTWPSIKWKGTQLLLFPLYARLKKEDILENPLRDDILHVVRETPGISASDLGRRLECGWGTLVYHITVLERMGLVSSAREGRHKRFFAQGRINYSDKGAVGLLANAAARTVLDAVRQSPGLMQKDLSLRLGLAPGTIAWHVDRLTAEGLLIKEEDGRMVRYYPSERLLELTRELAA